MRAWNGFGSFQWEHMRKFELVNGTSEFCRAEGALVIPGGFRSLSFFVRRANQSAQTFELVVWTTPVFFKPLDDIIDTTTAPQLLLPLVVEPAGALVMTGTTGKVFGARLKADQPMGTLLFWEMKNTGAATANMVADIYVVANHEGTLTLPQLGRTVETAGGHAASGGAVHAGMRK